MTATKVERRTTWRTVPLMEAWASSQIENVLTTPGRMLELRSPDYGEQRLGDSKRDTPAGAGTQPVAERFRMGVNRSSEENMLRDQGVPDAAARGTRHRNRGSPGSGLHAARRTGRHQKRTPRPVGTTPRTVRADRTPHPDGCRPLPVRGDTPVPRRKRPHGPRTARRRDRRREACGDTAVRTQPADPANPAGVLPAPQQRASGDGLGAVDALHAARHRAEHTLVHRPLGRIKRASGPNR